MHSLRDIFLKIWVLAEFIEWIVNVWRASCTCGEKPELCRSLGEHMQEFADHQTDRKKWSRQRTQPAGILINSAPTRASERNFVRLWRKKWRRPMVMEERIMFNILWRATTCVRADLILEGKKGRIGTPGLLRRRPRFVAPKKATAWYEINLAKGVEDQHVSPAASRHSRPWTAFRRSEIRDSCVLIDLDWIKKTRNESVR